MHYARLVHIVHISAGSVGCFPVKGCNGCTGASTLVNLVWLFFFFLKLIYFASGTLIPGTVMPDRYFSSCIQTTYCGRVYCSLAQKMWWLL